MTTTEHIYIKNEDAQIWAEIKDYIDKCGKEVILSSVIVELVKKWYNARKGNTTIDNWTNPNTAEDSIFDATFESVIKNKIKIVELLDKLSDKELTQLHHDVSQFLFNGTGAALRRRGWSDYEIESIEVGKKVFS